MKLHNYILGFALAGGIVLSGCEGLLDYQPIYEDVAEDAITSVEDLEAFQLSSYQKLSAIHGDKYQVTNFLLGDNIDGDHLKSGDFAQIYRRNTDWFNGVNSSLYGESYKVIARANHVMDYFEQAGVSEERALLFEAESRFLRALGHFSAVTMFAQPYGYTPDNNHLGVAYRPEFSPEFLKRNTVKEVYTNIIEDLKFAENNLKTENNNLATTWAAKAVLAKVYLQMNDMDNAYAYANDVIENSPFVLDPDFKDKFADFTADGTTENVFALISDADHHYGGELKNQFREGTSAPTFRISRDLYDQIPDGDLRKDQFIVTDEGLDTEYITLTKFEALFFDMPVVHLTELYFIRAEAALLKTAPELAVAQSDIEAVMQRAYGDPAFSLGTPSQSALLQELRLQKRIEMVGEGARLQDLKRIGAFESDGLEIRGADWKCPGMVLQFPRGEFKPGFEGNQEGGC